MNTSELTLAIVGCGTMGEAILAGLLHANRFSPSQLIGTVRRQEVANKLRERYAADVVTNNLEAARRANVVLFALKPQRIHDVLVEPGLQHALANKLVISIAAGIRVQQLAAWLPESAIVRAMPNTPCLIGLGMTVLARGPGATDQHIAIATDIFSAVGRCLELDDKHMDAVTSLNGSGPAFAYVMLEAIADGGVMMGLPRDTALEIAAHVFSGAAQMVLKTGRHPAALKDEVTTPAGSTIAGLLTMEDGRIRSVLARAIQEATKVAAGLGQAGSGSGYQPGE